MPTFDFHCKKCDAVFEFTRSFGSKSMPICPKCKSKRTEKLLTPPVIQFKGSGFYKTDHRTKTSEDKGTTAPSQKPAETKEAPKAEPKKEN